MKWSMSLLLFALIACNSNTKKTEPASDVKASNIDKPAVRTLTEAFKSYWYAGTAEISSYDLQQARYGEIRSGSAVLVFVTEPMNAAKQVKEDAPTSASIPVLKLNATRNFNTGIYPYTIMSSTFLPVYSQENALKITTSVQEWCGHVYMQLNKRNNGYNIASHSYFMTEGDTTLTLPDVVTEDQLLSQLRFGPDKMPQGDFQLLPSTVFLRLKHVEIAPVQATASLTNTVAGIEYKISMPTLDRTVSYITEKEFPYRILKWTDTYKDGADYLETTAILKKTIQSAYWNKNSNSDESLRATLRL